MGSLIRPRRKLRMEAGAGDVAGLFPAVFRPSLFCFPTLGARRFFRLAHGTTKAAGCLLWILPALRRVFCLRMRIRHGWVVLAAARAGSVTTVHFTLRRSATDLTIYTRFPTMEAHLSS